MRLQALLPTLRSCPKDEESLKQLLNTLSDLRLALPQDLILRYSAEQLFELLPYNCINQKQFISLYEEIATFLMPEVSKGDELYMQEISVQTDLCNACTLGVPSIDSLINLPQYGVVELAGFSGSGKTASSTFLNHMALKYLLEDEQRAVVWIDTLGTFSPEFANRVAEQLVMKSETDPLLRLQVASCPDLASAYDILEGVEIQRKDPHIVGLEPRMIVIDPITPLLGPSLSATSSKGHAMMVTFMRHIASMAKKYGILVFISNTATRVRPNPLQNTTKPKPSLGPSFTYLTDVSLFLSKGEQRPGASSRDGFRLKVLKNRGQNSGDVCRFGIQNGCIIAGNGRS